MQYQASVLRLCTFVRRLAPPAPALLPLCMRAARRIPEAFRSLSSRGDLLKHSPSESNEAKIVPRVPLQFSKRDDDALHGIPFHPLGHHLGRRGSLTAPGSSFELFETAGCKGLRSGTTAAHNLRRGEAGRGVACGLWMFGVESTYTFQVPSFARFFSCALLACSPSCHASAEASLGRDGSLFVFGTRRMLGRRCFNKPLIPRAQASSTRSIQRNEDASRLSKAVPLLQLHMLARDVLKANSDTVDTWQLHAAKKGPRLLREEVAQLMSSDAPARIAAGCIESSRRK